MLLHLGRSCLTQLCRGRKEGREIKYIDIYFLFLFAGDVQGLVAPSTEFTEFPLEICRVWEYFFLLLVCLVWFFF